MNDVVDLDELERRARESLRGSRVTLALIARIRELESGMADALYWLKPGLVEQRPDEAKRDLEQLSALLAKEPSFIYGPIAPAEGVLK